MVTCYMQESGHSVTQPTCSLQRMQSDFQNLWAAFSPYTPSVSQTAWSIQVLCWADEGSRNWQQRRQGWSELLLWLGGDLEMTAWQSHSIRGREPAIPYKFSWEKGTPAHAKWSLRLYTNYSRKPYLIHHIIWNITRALDYNVLGLRCSGGRVSKHWQIWTCRNGTWWLANKDNLDKDRPTELGGEGRSGKKRRGPDEEGPSQSVVDDASRDPAADDELSGRNQCWSSTFRSWCCPWSIQISLSIWPIFFRGST